jgi:hypothetical protein
MENTFVHAIYMGTAPLNTFLHFRDFPRASSSACCLIHGGLLLGLLSDPEDGGNMFIRNVG